jgi:hypothetical protein
MVRRRETPGETPDQALTPVLLAALVLLAAC